MIYYQVFQSINLYIDLAPCRFEYRLLKTYQFKIINNEYFSSSDSISLMSDAVSVSELEISVEYCSSLVSANTLEFDILIFILNYSFNFTKHVHLSDNVTLNIAFLFFFERCNVIIEIRSHADGEIRNLLIFSFLKEKQICIGERKTYLTMESFCESIFYSQIS